MPTSRTSSPLFLLIALAILAAGIFAAWKWGVFGKSGPDESVLLALIPNKDRAVAELENEQIGDVSIPADEFARIAAAVPGDPLGARNLAIFRVLDLKREPGKGSQGEAGEEEKALSEAEKATVFAEKLAAAQKAIAALRLVEPDAPSTNLLDSRVHLAEASKLTDPDQKAERVGQGVELLRRAAEGAKDDPALWYELHAVIESNHLEMEELSGLAAEKAYRAAPDNISAVLAQLIRLANQGSAEVATVWKEALPVLEPLADAVNSTDTSDLSAAQLLAGCGEQVEKNSLPMLARQLRTLDNIVKSRDLVRSDRQRLNRHELDYTLFQFRDESAIVARATAKKNPSETTGNPPAAFAFDSPIRPLPMNDPAAVAAQLHDLDLDGRMDLVVAQTSGLEVWLQTADGSFESAAKIETPEGVRGFVAIDLERYDENSGKTSFGPNPALPVSTLPTGAKGNTAYVGCVRSNGRCEMGPLDFAIYGDFGVQVFRNMLDTDERRLDFARADGNDDLGSVGRVHLVVSADFDHDSDLDLVLASEQGIRLFSNLGIFRFRDVSKWSRLPPASLSVTAICPVDWDRDLDLDLLITGNDKQSIGILENLRHGIVRWRTLSDDPYFAELAPAHALAVAELDGNVSWDLVAINDHAIKQVRTATHAGGSVRPIAKAATQTTARQMVVFDANHDGIQDLVAVGQGQKLTVCGGLPSGDFAAAIGFESATLASPPRSLDAADLDGDGDLDLLAVDGEGVAIFKNGVIASPDKPVASAGWLSLCAVGLADNKGRNNNNGIGSLVEVRGGGRYQAQVVHRQHTHFGIGHQKQADIVRIVWPNGMPQTLVRPGTNQMLCEHAILKGSCPYLYTWNGERYQFVTDCLWAAPIGLQVAEGVLAPCRPWEYLLVPGEALVERQGKYELRITEELWEAAYFDHVELIAVDHPADVEVYSNEKVGSPDIASYKVHTVRQRRYPIAAGDQRGRDVLSKLNRRDQIFLRPWDRQIQQGRVEPHYIELDLGDLKREGQLPQQVTLFLTGWIFPTDTSINVNLSQNPELDGPRFPYVMTPDASGNWVETQAFMGFPGGKTKTIAVDLSKAFASDDFRVRIASTAQLYWDEAFFTVDESPGEVVTNAMNVASADLRYRGFSRIVPQPEHAPDAFDYHRVSVTAQWAPMAGNFTRYGKVSDLLSSEDDRMVAMGAGDEMALAFDATGLPPLPTGWKRDFLLHALGWDKDADLHTVCGQMVEPLPFVAMTEYPPLPDLKDHQWESFVERERVQSQGRERQASWGEFWRALHPSSKALDPAVRRIEKPASQVTPDVDEAR